MEVVVKVPWNQVCDPLPEGRLSGEGLSACYRTLEPRLHHSRSNRPSTSSISHLIPLYYIPHSLSLWVSFSYLGCDYTDGACPGIPKVSYECLTYASSIDQTSRIG